MAQVSAHGADYAQFPIAADKDGWRRVFWVKLDRADWDLVAQYSWYISWDGRMAYAHTFIGGKKKGRTVTMGRLILGEGELGNLGRVDHMNGNGLDCRRHNIRIVTQSRLLARRRPAGGASEYKGVSWDAVQRKWLAAFRGKKIGRFVDEKDAARAFDEVALAYWGPDCYLNFPPRPRGVRMTGPRARALTYAIEQCLDTEEIQRDDAAEKMLRAARDLVERWARMPINWTQPDLPHLSEAPEAAAGE